MGQVVGAAVEALARRPQAHRESRFSWRGCRSTLVAVQITVRARFTAPTIATQRLGELLRERALPPGWSFEATPTTVVLSAPELRLSPDQQGHAGEVVLSVAKATEIVHAACDGRDDIRPYYFVVDPAGVQRRNSIDAT
jgi:hypothetical protein